MEKKSVAYETYLGAKWIDIYMLQEDSKRLRIYSKYYTETYSIYKLGCLAKENNQPLSLDSAVVIPMHCIPLSMVIIYAKMFDKSSHRKPKPYTLDKGIFNKSEELLKNHNKIIDQRNKYFAHDENYFGTLPRLRLYKDNDRFNLGLSEEPGIILSCPQMEYPFLEPLLDKIDETLTKKEQETYQLLFGSEMNQLIQNKKRVLDKLKRNSVISNDDLNTWKKLK